MTPTAKKKKMRARQGSVNRRKSGGGLDGNRRRRADSAGSGSLSPGSGRSKPNRAELKRSQGTRSLLPGQPDARRARANAGADLNPHSPPTVRKPPALKRSHAAGDVRQAGRTAAPGKVKRDLRTGRALFPVDVGGGKINYLPAKSEANAQEKKRGLFVETDSMKQEPTNTLSANGKSLPDYATGRILFATERSDGRAEYLPKESDATAFELSQGKYISDESVESPPIGNRLLDKRPLFEFANQRSLFATEGENGKIQYLPKRSEANAYELKKGRYVKDEDISLKTPLGVENSLSNEIPRYDIGKGRTVYAITTPDGKPLYLPRESEADAFEQMRGLYIPDEIIDRHEEKLRRTALKNDGAYVEARRAQRAAQLHGGTADQKRDLSIEPVTEADDGTELWDGSSVPDVSEKKQRETLQKLMPRYDLGKGRMVYPAETAKGKIKYLPLAEEATDTERLNGQFAAFVPPEPLQDFLENATKRQTFDTDSGEVNAFRQADIQKAFESAPTLVLRSAGLVSKAAVLNPALQQEWSSG